MQFKTAIEQLFTGIEYYREDVEDGQISFDCFNNCISLATLLKLSEILGTTEINFAGDRHVGKYDSDERGEIEARNVRFTQVQNWPTPAPQKSTQKIYGVD